MAIPVGAIGALALPLVKAVVKPVVDEPAKWLLPFRAVNILGYQPPART
jgi:hypothetical protein